MRLEKQLQANINLQTKSELLTAAEHNFCQLDLNKVFDGVQTLFLHKIVLEQKNRFILFKENKV